MTAPAGGPAPDLENQRFPSASGGGAHTVRAEPCPRRLRVVFNGEVVADSTSALYLFETAHLPVYYFPVADVRMELLEPSALTTRCPYKGEATYHSIVVGGRRSADAVWRYVDPIPGCPDISGHVAFFWNRVDAWFEEDEEVFVHARDPYKRIDVLHSSRHVQVVVGGLVVADTRRPRLLFETGLPMRCYIPRLDVRTDLLEASTRRTRCPYKGEAVYWSVVVGDRRFDDVVWSYPAPIPEIPKIEHLLCFFDEKVDCVIIDGVEQARPVTSWS